MGLDEFVVEDGNSTDSNDIDDEDGGGSGESNDIDVIVGNIKERAVLSDFDITVENEQIRGSVDDVAMLFALMTMDYDEASIYELIGETE